jgi:hypothetical protein
MKRERPAGQGRLPSLKEAAALDKKRQGKVAKNMAIP